MFSVFLLGLLIALILIPVIWIFGFTQFYPRKNTFNYECNNARHKNLDAKTMLSDKFEVKGYLSENFPDVKCPKTLHEIKQPDDIAKIGLPRNFIMKNSTGCGGIRIIRNGKIIHKKGWIEGQATIHNLMKVFGPVKGVLEEPFRIRSYLPYTDFSEPHYHMVKPRIFIEEYLYGVTEFRLYYNKARLLVIEWLGERGADGDYYTEDWKQLPNIFTGKIRSKKHPRPDCLDRILKFGNEVTTKNDFDILRLDLHLKTDGTDFYFGEFTFCPSNCLSTYTNNFQTTFKQGVY